MFQSSKEDYFHGGHEPAVEEKEIHVEGVKVIKLYFY